LFHNQRALFGDLKGQAWDEIVSLSHHLSPISTMPFFEGAHDFNIKGGSFNDVSGNMTINDTSRRTTNHGSYNTTNRNYDNSKIDRSTNDYSTGTLSSFSNMVEDNSFFRNDEELLSGDGEQLCQRKECEYGGQSWCATALVLFER
jgi:hypothetical protein